MTRLITNARKMAKDRLRVWTLVLVVSSQIMTLYLWHLTSMILLVAGGMVFSGFGFGLEPFTSVWWLTRPIWFVCLVSLTVFLSLVFGRFERPRKDARPAPSAWRPVVAAVMICAGLGSIAAVGIADEMGMNGLLVTLPVAGMVVGGVIGASWFERPTST